MTSICSLSLLGWSPESTDAARWRWGWGWLERKLGPAKGGDLLVIGARDGVGKSFLALHMLHAMAVTGQPGTYISLEDGVNDVAPRLATGLAHENLHLVLDIEGGMLSGVLDAIGEAPGPTVVDYLQLVQDDISAGRAWSKADQVAGAVRAIRAKAKAVDRPVVLLSQVGRCERDEDPYEIPSRYRMQDSPAAINNMATYVVMLGQESDKQHVVAELQKAKGAQVGGRTRLRRGEGGRLVTPAKVSGPELMEGGSDDV